MKHFEEPIIEIQTFVMADIMSVSVGDDENMGEWN